MYLPKHFEESRAEVLQELIRTHPLGLLVTLADAGLQANPVPFILDADPAGGPGILRAHVARANPLWRETRSDVEALVVFQGPQAYVSPNWYPSKAEHGKAVPTWNYTMVQAHGTLRAIEDPAWLLAFVTRLTERHEGGRAMPWHVADAPADYIESMLRAIVGIEIDVSRLEGKFKLSQNRPAEDRTGVVLGLEADSALALQPEADALAQQMLLAEQRRRDAGK
jgi:transcriptional regulator